MADFMTFPTPRERVLRYGNTTIGIIPDICLVSHFQVGTWRVLYRPDETGNVKRWGMPLMIPNFSRLKDGMFQEKGTSLPIHGFGRMMPWTVTEMSETALTMQLSSSDATRIAYPYEFTFTANIVVGEGTLTYTLTMENRSSENLPIAPGFHPYFIVAQEKKSALVTEGLAGFAVQDFDWVEHIPDNPYPFAHSVSVEFPGRGTLTIEEQAQNSEYALHNMQVWSEPPSKPDHEFVCFEPAVGSEDALNRPADRLNIEAGQSRRIVLLLRANPS
jgi:galactose mutarotase-like enzyme